MSVPTAVIQVHDGDTTRSVFQTDVGGVLHQEALDPTTEEAMNEFTRIHAEFLREYKRRRGRATPEMLERLNLVRYALMDRLGALRLRVQTQAN